MEEKEINHIIEQFDDSFLHHVSWMSEKKQQELNRLLEHLKELKNKKSILKLERNKLQEEIENISDLYEQELKKVLTRVPSLTCWQLAARVALVMALKPTPHGTS